MRSSCIRSAVILMVLLAVRKAHAQPLALSVEGWGQTYRPAALTNLEARAHEYPWLTAEAQVWTGQVPREDGFVGDVVVLAAHLREPTGHADARVGRFVLSTGAVRPLHLDGASARVQNGWGTALELFGGVPVTPRFASRAYDWLVGTRLSQRVAGWATLGASYVERRDRGAEVDEEVGADLVVYPYRRVDVSGRFSYDLVSQGLSEIQATASLGDAERRVQVFTSLRNASLIIPATSLFSVLSEAVSVQAGASARYRLAPRLRVGGVLAYRGVDDAHGLRMRADATLWLDDEGDSAVEGAITRDGVEGQRWTGWRALVYRDVIERLRVMMEVELVRADRELQGSQLWPWGRVSSRYSFPKSFELSMGAEGSASPQFFRLFQALVRLAYVGGAL